MPESDADAIVDFGSQHGAAAPADVPVPPGFVVDALVRNGRPWGRVLLRRR